MQKSKKALKAKTAQSLNEQLTALEPSKHDLVLLAVNDLVFMVDLNDAESMLHQLMREFVASKVWAESVTYDFKLTMMDNYIHLLQFFMNINACIKRP